MMREIERQATEAWVATPCEVGGLGGTELAAVETRRAVVGYDFLVVRIPLQAQIDGDQGGSAQPGRSRPEKRRKKAHHGGESHHRNGGGGGGR